MYVVVYEHATQFLNMFVMGLVLGQSFWSYLSWVSCYNLCKSISPFNVLWECIVVVYKHFDMSMHVGSVDPTCVQNFGPIPPTVFEILGFKLKNKNDNKENWRNKLFTIFPMLVVQF